MAEHRVDNISLHQVQKHFLDAFTYYRLLANDRDHDLHAEADEAEGAVLRAQLDAVAEALEVADRIERVAERILAREPSGVSWKVWVVFVALGLAALVLRAPRVDGLGGRAALALRLDPGTSSSRGCK